MLVRNLLLCRCRVFRLCVVACVTSKHFFENNAFHNLVVGQKSKKKKKRAKIKNTKKKIPEAKKNLSIGRKKKRIKGKKNVTRISTNVRALPTVNSNVNFQVGGTTEGLIASLPATYIGLFLRRLGWGQFGFLRNGDERS
jgi:hypothetical protein